MQRVTSTPWVDRNNWSSTLAEPLRPGPGQVLVDVEAAGVNSLDIYQRKGLSPVSLPFSPGYEGVGRVREIGRDVARNSLSIGDGVAWINSRGSYAIQVLIPAAEAIPVPKTSRARKLSSSRP